MDWRARAACRDEDPEIFFPTATEVTPHGWLEVAEAQRVCDRCPVRRACLSSALESGEEFGIWGGLTEKERRALRRRRSRREVRT